MKFTFTPDHIVIADLFASNTNYIIPEYQRPYSWDCIGKSEKNNQINVMWEDLLSFFQSRNEDEYFFGSMVMIEKKNRHYEVIDGQQRLTSLVILFVAIKCFLKKINDDTSLLGGTVEKIEALKEFLPNAIETINDVIYNKKTMGLSTQKKVKIEKSSEFDYDKVLSDVMECIDPNSTDTINDEQKKVVRRYYENRDFLIGKIEDTFLDAGKLGEEQANQLERFADFLKYRLSIVRIVTPDFERAYQIFEILNNRGLPLSNKDLFRNFIIQQFTKKQQENPNQSETNPSEKWNFLDNNYTLNEEFIARWVESKKASQQKYSAFNDLKDFFDKNYDNINRPKIDKLYDDIKTDLGYYSLITGNEIKDNYIKNKLYFLSNAPNLKYSVNLLLSLFRFCEYRGEENAKLVEFITIYEQYFLYGFLSKGKRFTSVPIYNAIKALNRKDFETAKKEFLISDAKKRELKGLINGSFKDNTNAKLMLAKYFWTKDSQIDDVINQNLDFSKATLEHIIPQNPASGTNWINNFSLSFRNKNTYRLGNMTLLTQRVNSSAKNYDFEKKKKKYTDTKLWITQKLSVIPQFDEEFFVQRQKEITEAIYKDLNL